MVLNLSAFDFPENPNPEPQAVAYGLESPEPIGKFLDGKLPASTPGASVSEWTVVNAFPNITFVDPVDMREYPGTNRFLLAGKDGRLWTFENDPNVSTQRLFLDIRSRVRTAGDCGILGVIFHPDFGKAGSPNRGYFYLYYRYTQQKGRGDQLAYVRLSRFTVQDGQQVADPQSEYVMIQHYDRHDWHNGGSMFFGPEDGFLYLIIGDEGGALDEFESGQKINHGLFAGILRIDVDRRGGNISHPIRRQPKAPVEPPSGWPETFSQGYYIPNDNPWVNPDGSTMEEFWAIGLRSPHRMWYDEPSGDIWVGDIGQGSREEISILHKGDNAQWPYKEGFRNGSKPKPSNLIGKDTPPVLDYNRSVGSSVIGGIVYREGKWANSLGGKYIFSDNVVQNIWVVDYYNSGSNNMEVLTSIPFLTDNWKDGVSHIWADKTGEVYILQLAGHNRGGGRIYKLAPQSQSGINAPRLLSQTGAFSNIRNLTPAEGVIPYDVNIPFWSDGALKYRWVAVPNDGNHNSASEKIKFSQNAEWEFPRGSAFIKHMDLRVDDTDPSKVKRIETRLMVLGDDDIYYSLTYRWRDDESDAELVDPVTGANRTVNIKTANGTRQYVWRYPSSSECRTCHNSGAKQVLGVNSRQLNKEMLYPKSGTNANQLETMNHLGWFDQNLNEGSIPGYTTLPDLEDNSVSLENRARAYLDVNCSYCHQPNGVKANFDARFTTPLENQNLILVDPDDDLGIEHAKFIAPGDPSKSVIYQRIHSVEEGTMMPPLAKKVIDNQGVTIIRDWINSMDPVCLDPPDITVVPSNAENCGGFGSVSIINSRNGSNFEVQNALGDIMQDLEALPAGAYSYTYTDGACNDAGNFTITQPDKPQVSLTALEGVDILTEPFSLTGGSPAGGTYSGPGVSNNIFDPEQAGPGKHTIVYTYSTSNGCEGTASQILVVIAENISQAISFEQIEEKETLDEPFELEAFASSELPVTFEVLDGPASISGNMCTLDKLPGTVRIRATQEGNGLFAPATPIVQTFEVKKVKQRVQIEPISDKAVNAQSFQVEASSTYDLPVDLELVEGPATLAGNIVILTGTAGTVTIRATQAGNESIEAAEPATISFEVSKISQTLALISPDTIETLTDPFELQVEASSQLPVTLTLISGPGSLENGVLSLDNREGKIQIRAEQEGNETYDPAPPETFTLTVVKARQSIQIAPIAEKWVNSPSFSIQATSSRELPVALTLLEGPATLSGNICILNGDAGTVRIRATQTGTEDIQAAEPVEFSFEVRKLTQEIVIEDIPDSISALSDPFSLEGLATSGLPVSIEIVEGPAFIRNDSIVLMRMSGDLVLSISQTGDDTYAEAEPVSITIFLRKVNQTISFPPFPVTVPMDISSFPLEAYANSGLPVKFRVLTGPAFVQGPKTLILTGIEGKVDVEAYQDGDTLYNRAPSIIRSFAVSNQISINDSITVSNRELLDPETVGIQVYPNPAHHTLHISWQTASRTVQEISVYTLQGQLVKQINLAKSQRIYSMAIPVENLPVGSYLLRMKDTQNQHYKLMWGKQ